MKLDDIKLPDAKVLKVSSLGTEIEFKLVRFNFFLVNEFAQRFLPVHPQGQTMNCELACEVLIDYIESWSLEDELTKENLLKLMQCRGGIIARLVEEMSLIIAGFSSGSVEEVNEVKKN